MKKDKKGVNDQDKHVQVKINTTFSGNVARFILSQQEQLNCSAPEVLRRILTKHVTHHPIFLNKELAEIIKKTISNPIIRERYGLISVDMFATWAMQRCLESLQAEIGNLKHPSVQAILNSHEKEVARQLLLLSSNLKHYGGITIDQLARATGLERDVVAIILKEFVRNGWVIEKKEEDLSYFLPKD